MKIKFDDIILELAASSLYKDGDSPFDLELYHKDIEKDRDVFEIQ